MSLALGAICLTAAVPLADSASSREREPAAGGSATDKSKGPAGTGGAQSMAKSIIGNGGASTTGASHTILGTLGTAIARVASLGSMPDENVCSGFWCVDLTGTVDTPEPRRPGGIEFGRPHPNPTTGAMRIRFALPRSALVEAQLIDVAGRKVRLLTREAMSPGTGTLDWDGRDDKGRAVEAGVYFLLVHVDRSEVARSRVVIMR